MKIKTHAFIAAVACIGLAGVTWAQTKESALDLHIDFTVKDADLMQALDVLTKNTGLKFVVKPGHDEFGKVNLRLEDTPAGDVLTYVCQAAGARAVRDDNGVYIVYGPGAEVESTQHSTPTTTKTILKKISIMHENPMQLMAKLAGDPIMNVNEIPDSIQAPPIQVSPAFTNPTDARNEATNAVKAQSDAGGFQRGSVGTGAAGGGGGQFGGGGQQGGGVNGQGGGVGGGGGGFSTLRPANGNLVPQGTTKIMYDPTDNSLLFQGTPEAYRELLNLLAIFDVAPQQIEVKLEFVTYSKNLDSSFGIDWLYERGGVFFGATPGTFARSSDQIFFNWASGNVSARLRTELLGGSGTTISAPLVRTLNNEVGRVTFQTNIAIFNTTSTTANGVVSTSSTVTILPITSQLVVRPRINGDKTITMGLSPTISNLGQLRRGPDGQEVPDTITQQAGVVAIVRDRETVAIGGLTSDSSTGTYSKIPLLADLPLIGGLFRSRTESVNNTELVIFVTPSIVGPDDTGLGNE